MVWDNILAVYHHKFSRILLSYTCWRVWYIIPCPKKYNILLCFFKNTYIVWSETTCFSSTIKSVLYHILRYTYWRVKNNILAIQNHKFSCFTIFCHTHIVKSGTTCWPQHTPAPVSSLHCSNVIVWSGQQPSMYSNRGVWYKKTRLDIIGIATVVLHLTIAVQWFIQLVCGDNWQPLYHVILHKHNTVQQTVSRNLYDVAVIWHLCLHTQQYFHGIILFGNTMYCQPHHWSVFIAWLIDIDHNSMVTGHYHMGPPVSLIHSQYLASIYVHRFESMFPCLCNYIINSFI